MYPERLVTYTNEGNQVPTERLESHTLVRETMYPGKVRVSYTSEGNQVPRKG